MTMSEEIQPGKTLKILDKTNYNKVSTKCK